MTQQIPANNSNKLIYILVGAVLAAILIGGLSFILLSDDEPKTATGQTTDNDDAEATTTTKYIAPANATPCPSTDGESERKTSFEAEFQNCLTPGASYAVKMVTNKGTMEFELDSEAAPISVNNFVSLARNKYYDGTTFHRVIEDFMIQGGDATGEPRGTGTPGYTIIEEPPASSAAYKKGTLAMAKSAGPKATGGQFFIMGVDNSGLPPEYSVFGEITSGLETVDAIRTVEVNGETPAEDVIIESVTITETAE